MLMNLLTIHPSAAACRLIVGDEDRHLLRFLAFQVKSIYVAAILKNDGVISQRRELDVKIRKAVSFCVCFPEGS